MKYAILSEITASVSVNLAARKAKLSFSDLEKQGLASRTPHDFLDIFRRKIPVIIAEIKFKSPTHGLLNKRSDAKAIAAGYLASGASALSILTEESHFQGSLANLKNVRGEFPESHLLMKDFIIDEYQIAEALVFGADAVLLIAALLDNEKLRTLFNYSLKLGLTPLVEVHDAQEFKIAVDLGARLIGVNNRNLKTMEISMATSFELAALAPKKVFLVSESGLSSANDVRALIEVGYSGFLIGSSFMREADPGKALSRLVGEFEK